MSVYFADYKLVNGFVHNWLVAGPQAIPVPDLDHFKGEDFKLRVARHYHEEDSGITQDPLDWAPLTIGDAELRWHYVRCQEDHFLDLTAFYHTCHYLRAWAYAQVESPSTQEVTIVLTTNGPADVWLNGQHVHRQEHFYQQIPHSVPFQATFHEGRNQVLVRFEEVATRDCPYAMALQIVGLAGDGAQVLLPTPNKALARRRTLERTFEAAYLDRDVYVWDERITVRLPEGMRAPSMTVRLQTPSGRIYGESIAMGRIADEARMNRPYQLPEGRFQAVLMPTLKEYYEQDLRIERRTGLWAVKNRYSQEPYGTFPERVSEALDDAARREQNIYSEIAKMAFGKWQDVRNEAITAAIEGINRREDCSDFYLVGLLGMIYRFGNDPSFPQELKQPLEDCILGFKYWMDEPGEDAMCYWSENHQILFHTCEILAGQLYPDHVFANTGRSGRWHREKGERMATTWLKKRGAGGFREWDSNCYFEEDLLALSHLVDLAENPQVYDLAAVVMDKTFFSMALNSYRGVFGSTHGRAYAPQIKGGRLEATAGIGRLMWGLGVFNHCILGTVSLACVRDYELPPIIGAIATDLPEEMWNRERHAGELEEWCDCASGAWEVNKVTYKTPDYMLCSAQDYHPGEPGQQQHIWQATMGPDAVTFVTHPPCVSEEGSHRPNFWHGNVVLPRVAQWKDVLVAIHRLPEDDWMGFTHAYFPVRAFDEHTLRDGWAFARKGEAYLALTAAQGLDLITRGDSAYRELRSYGQHNVWLCHMGRAAQDGNFGEFQEKMLALRIAFEGLGLQCTTLRGQSLAFGWEGPLLVDGQEQPIGGFKHYENPYCVVDLPASQMEIRFGDQALRLNFD